MSSVLRVPSTTSGTMSATMIVTSLAFSGAEALKVSGSLDLSVSGSDSHISVALTVASELSVVATNWQQAYGCACASDGAENPACIDSVNPAVSCRAELFVMDFARPQGKAELCVQRAEFNLKHARISERQCSVSFVSHVFSN